MFVHKEVEWNYLIYMAADNNLERFAISNIKALQTIGSTNNANILVLFDRSPGYDRSEGNWSGTKLFLISKNPKSMNNDVIFDYGELDMTDSDNIYNFLKTAKRFFPAKHTVLNIWSHGRGVYPDGIITKGVIEDYTTGYGANNIMSIIDFASAINKYKSEDNAKVDIIQFDCCDMQMIEVCYQLKDVTDYIIGASTQIPGNGSDYSAIIKYLCQNSDISSRDFAKFIAESFYEYQANSKIDFSYSVLDTAKIAKFIEDLDEACENLINADNSLLSQIFSFRAEFSQNDPAYPEFCDVSELITCFARLGIQVDGLSDKFDLLLLVYRSIGQFSEKGKGLGINFPYTAEQFNYYTNDKNRFSFLDIYLDTKLDEFLLKLYSLII